MAASKVCIWSERDAVDLVLPSEIPIIELMPAIVDLLDDGAAPGEAAHHWRLDRPTGAPLEEDSSLSDNGIRDGDLLILTKDESPSLGVERTEPWQRAIGAQPSTSPLGEALPDTLALVAITGASVALAWTTGSDRAGPGAIIAALGAVIAMVLSFFTNHPTQQRLSSIVMSGTAGFLVVPSGPGGSNVFLAATAAFSASMVISRLSGGSSAPLTAIAALSLPTAVATLLPMPTVAIGAMLSTVSLGLLALAPRLSVVAAGLADEDRSHDGIERAEAAHAMLSGIVAGCAAAGAAGAVVAVIAGHTVASVAFCALVAVALLLRARTYVDASRRNVLLATGLVTSGAGLISLCATWQDFLVPVAGVLIAAGLLAPRWPMVGPTAARVLDRCEYAASAAVAPVALWVAGWHLPWPY